MNDSGKTSNQMALIGFAARLGTCVSKGDGSIAIDGDLRQEAQLLMSLMSLTSTTSIIEEQLSGDEDVSESVDRSSEEERPLVETLSTSPQNQNFAFSCPSLSLHDSSFQHCPSTISRQVTNDTGKPILPPVQPPAVLLSRPLGVDDRDAMRLSAEAMARNMLQSFHTAVQWRIDTWVNELAASLVGQERELIAMSASNDELLELLQSSEAKVLASLQHGASQFDVLDARTSYRVLPQRMEQDSSAACTASPSKKRRIANECKTNYNVTHGLSFQTVLSLSTSAGFTEVTLEAPGIIEGTFTMTEAGEEKLIGVSVQIDTRVLARMIEKSSRVVVRTAAHASLEASLSKPAVEWPSAVPECTYSPQRELTTSTSSDSEELTHAGVVTPRYPSPKTTPYGDSDPESMENFAFFSLPEDLERTIGDTKAFLRLVSPQPRSHKLSFNPRTPTTSGILVPLLLSPQGQTESFQTVERSGPSLPALVEAACNARRTPIA